MRPLRGGDLRGRHRGFTGSTVVGERTYRGAENARQVRLRGRQPVLPRPAPAAASCGVVVELESRMARRGSFAVTACVPAANAAKGPTSADVDPPPRFRGVRNEPPGALAENGFDPRYPAARMRKSMYFDVSREPGNRGEGLGNAFHNEKHRPSCWQAVGPAGRKAPSAAIVPVRLEIGQQPDFLGVSHCVSLVYEDHDAASFRVEGDQLGSARISLLGRSCSSRFQFVGVAYRIRRGPTKGWRGRWFRRS